MKYMIGKERNQDTNNSDLEIDGPYMEIRAGQEFGYKVLIQAAKVRNSPKGDVVS